MIVGPDVIRLMGKKGAGGSLLPVRVGANQSTSGNPTMPAHVLGDLLIVAASRTSSALVTADAAWTTWASSVSGANSMIYFWLRATANNHTITLTNAAGLRQAWCYRNAALDGTPLFATGSTTTVNWGGPLTQTANSLTGGYIYAVQAQTNIGVVLPAGMTQRGIKNTSAAALSFDSGDTRTSSLTPANGTLDGAAGTWISSLFSIKGIKS